jgi:hypothetical protein
VIITDSVFVPLGHELPFRHFRRSHTGIEGIEPLSHYFLSRNDKNTAPAGCAYLFVIISRQTHHEIILLCRANPTKPDHFLVFRKFKPARREWHEAEQTVRTPWKIYEQENISCNVILKFNQTHALILLFSTPAIMILELFAHTQSSTGEPSLRFSQICHQVALHTVAGGWI